MTPFDFSTSIINRLLKRLLIVVWKLLVELFLEKGYFAEVSRFEFIRNNCSVTNVSQPLDLITAFFLDRADKINRRWMRRRKFIVHSTIVPFQSVIGPILQLNIFLFLVTDIPLGHKCL